MKNQTIWNRKKPKSSPHGQDYGLSRHHSDCGEGSVPGIKISGVSKGSPADKAGLTAGDIIVELAGRKLELEIVPGSRE